MNTRRDAATVKLPEIAPDGVATFLDFFVRRFPRVPAEVWSRRFDEGKVFCEEGALAAGAPYRPLLEVHYIREVEREWPVRVDYRVVYEDADLLVVDKPPFLPVTPGGHYLRNCLLRRLVEATDNDELAPLHRLDKDTSGVTLFSKRAATRSRFVDLFREPAGRLSKEYLALCDARAEPPGERTRLEDHVARSGEAYHLQAVVPGRPPNAVCEIEVVERAGERALFRVFPLTGRKHQIRVQLRHAGFPIVNDRLYGLRPRHDPDDLSDPLQLNCHRIVLRGHPTLGGGGVAFEWRSAWRDRVELSP